MKNEIDLSYKYCKENQILLEKDHNQVIIKYTNDTKISAISYFQKYFNLPLNLSKLPFKEFNKALSDNFTNNTSASEDLIENIDENIDLDSLVSNLPKTEDLLDDSNDAPVIRLINAILSEAIKDVETREKKRPSKNKPKIKNSRILSIFFHQS